MKHGRLQMDSKRRDPLKNPTFASHKDASQSGRYTQWNKPNRGIRCVGENCLPRGLGTHRS